MLNHLPGVILRFREEEVGMVGDISKMYHSISISVSDQMTHCFLWRDLDLQRNPDTYVITVVNFGNTPSATIAMIALRKTAELSQDDYPKASKIILENSYMDDIADSIENEEKSVKVCNEIDEILKRGGFFTKGWILSALKGCLKDGNVERKEIRESLKVLGVGWENVDDKLFCEFKIYPKGRSMYVLNNSPVEELDETKTPNFTKRYLLSRINALYDPLGVSSPFTVRAKIMLRKLWTIEPKLNWDDPIPEGQKVEWEKFFEEAKKLKNVKFNRCLKPVDTIGDPTLVLFSDASKEAYGTVAYARWPMKDGKFEARLISSKCRVAPLKIIDIVRLELAGAVLSKRMRVFLKKEMRYNFTEVYHLVDSEIVKAMVHKESYGFNTYVANRIGEIQEKTDPEEWMWIPGKLNIADWVTRGKVYSELGEGSLWQTGPKFLEKAVDEWPVVKEVMIQELPEQIKKFSVNIAQIDKMDGLAERIDINRFSKSDC